MTKSIHVLIQSEIQEQAKETLLKNLNEKYVRTHKEYMNMLDRYQRNLVSFNTYKQLDSYYETRIKALLEVNQQVLHYFNTIK